MVRIKQLIQSAVLAVVSMSAMAQSTNEVEYLLTYSAENAEYTAWIVPSYGTPNAYNPNSEEMGATAQFSIRIPRGFQLKGVQDVHGIWDKAPVKLDTQSEYFKSAGYSDSYDYLVFGKAPVETNYGPFEANKPVALFKFQANMAGAELLKGQDEFVRVAYDKFSLNVSPSFYSRSGQRRSPEAVPQEQYIGNISLRDVLSKEADKLGDKNWMIEEKVSVISYPNPTTDVLFVKYFVPSDVEKVQIDVLDSRGSSRKKETVSAKAGFNTVKLDVSNQAAGSFLVRVATPEGTLTKKVVKL